MDDLALARALTVVVRLVVDEMHERLVAEGFADLRPAQGYVLNAAAREGVTASELAGILGMTKQGAAKLLAEMVDAGYVTRGRSDADARARPVVLTPRGRALCRWRPSGPSAPSSGTGRDSTSPDDVATTRRVLETVIVAHDADGPHVLRPVW